MPLAGLSCFENKDEGLMLGFDNSISEMSEPDPTLIDAGMVPLRMYRPHARDIP